MVWRGTGRIQEAHKETSTSSLPQQVQPWINELWRKKWVQWDSSVFPLIVVDRVPRHHLVLVTGSTVTWTSLGPDHS